jgi:hypothetical protein
VFLCVYCPKLDYAWFENSGEVGAASGVAIGSAYADERGVQIMISQRLRSFLLLSTSSILLVACQPARVVSSTPHRNLDDFTVDLRAYAGATKIDVTSPAQGCIGAGATEKGCVHFAQAKQGAIWLLLNHNQKRKTCQSMPPADWVITKVELSAFDTGTGKGVFGGSQAQPQWLVDAFPGVEEATGVLYTESDLSKASQKALIINLNNHTDGVPKTAYYQVTASACAGSSPPIMTDPSIENTGK